MALVNRKAWSDLPKEYQAMFSTACYEANLGMLSDYERREQRSLCNASPAKASSSSAIATTS